VSARRLAGAALLATFASCTAREPSPQMSPSSRAAPRGSGLSVVLITIDTLRADHLGLYGYRRRTSPNIDALGGSGAVFDAAYTFWPKTRGSFVMIHTGRRPSQNGYSRRHPVLLGFNPTIAGVLAKAGYLTTAVVDNPNVAAQYGYAEGFARYRETWEEKGLVTEMDRARAITDDGIAFLGSARPERPFFLWLHYVNPHAPYTPPPPYDTAFLDAASAAGPALPVVKDFHGGIPRQWAVAGHDRRGYYVAQYDGEIAAVDHEVGRVIAALETSPARDRTVVVLTSDHGESLGEHDYYFDHGENLFDPCLRIPLIVVAPGGPHGVRLAGLASTLDLMPTILDAAKVSYPPDLAGESLLPLVEGRGAGPKRRLEAENERDLAASFDVRYKTVRTPTDGGARFALYDREADPGETRDVGPARPDALRTGRRELELFLERSDREWARTRPLVQGRPEGEGKMTVEACEKMKALGYVQQCAP
jgi:arylsulfatase A-like enzyme